MQWLASATPLAHTVGFNVSRRELAAALGNGLAVQAEQGGGAAVTATTAKQGGQAGKQAPLLLVQHAAEHGDGGRQAGVGLERVGRRREARRVRTLDAASMHLALLAGRLGGAVQGASAGANAGEVALAHQQGESVDGTHAEQVVEFGRPEAELGGIDQGLCGGAESAAGGEADLVVGPQSERVELGGLAQGVELATVGVAADVADGLELADDGAGGSIAESGGQLRESGNRLAAQEVGEGVRGEGGGAHAAIMADVAYHNIVRTASMRERGEPLGTEVLHWAVRDNWVPRHGLA